MRYQIRESSNIIKLAAPFFIASVAQVGMSFVDTVMAGGVSVVDMASVSIASSIWLPAILFGIGMMMALVSVVAYLNGSNEQNKIPFEIQQGIALSLIIALPILFVLSESKDILSLMNIEPLMAKKTIGYINAVMYAVPAFLLFQTLRSFTDGISLTHPAMVISFIGLIFNIPLNWIFVYGKFGMPALGGIGCGVATTIVYWLMFFLLLFYLLTSKRVAHIKIFKKFYKPQIKAIIRLFKLGFPVAAAIFFEVSLFAVVAILIAPLGSLIVGAHQVVINFSALIYMLPMSIGAAVSIRVGHKLGEKKIKEAMKISYIGLAIGLCFAISTASFTIIFRENVIGFYTNNENVIAIAMQLMLFAAAYQCADAIQVVATGALRGYKDMVSIFSITFISYWIIGLPIGYILGMTNLIIEPLGVYGFWIGFIVGLSSAAIMLGLRLRWMHKQSKEIQLTFVTR